jgi:CHAD domain-containing protein
MREKLEGMLGLRGLTTVVESKFRRRKGELRNKAGKIVCRLEWASVSPGKRRGEELLQYCRVMPLLGYESEAARVMDQLTRAGASTSGDGPLVVLLRHAGRIPQQYTLRPVFGLSGEMPAREAVRRIVCSILEIAARNVPGILKDLDSEFLHDYRICLRKIRSVLSLVKEIYPAEETQRIRAIVGDLARQTNRLRDLDVYLLARDEYRELLPPGLRPTLDKMFKDFSTERVDEVRRVTAKLRAPSWHKLFREIEEYFSQETPHESSPAADLHVGPLAFGRIYKRYRKVREIARDIGAEASDEMVHQLRIECKKLRYLMEFFNELIPGDEGAAQPKLLRRLQNRLGEFNDASVQQISLLNYWERHKSKSDTALGVGGLVSILYQRQQLTRGLIDQELEVFCSGSTATSFKRTFKLPASIAATVAPRAAHQ